jgi:signal transduction histidine kinase
VAHEALLAQASLAAGLAADRERYRLTVELHDAVGQLIFGIKLEAEAAGLLLRQEPERLPAHLERLQGLTGRALAELRAMIGQWRS